MALNGLICAEVRLKITHSLTSRISISACVCVHERRQDFLCRGAKWGQSRGLGGGGKEKSILLLLNINRAKKLKYWW